jgi:hypothetical protein
MRLQPRRLKRRGSVLPLVAMCTIAMMGMVALAIDIGMVAIARNQCQNAADSAAMAGARTINGNSTGNYNVAAVPTNAIIAATANKVFGTQITGNPNTNWTDPSIQAQVHPDDATYITGQVTIQVGTYAYTYNDASPGSEGFASQFPRSDATEPYSAVKATVTYQGKFAFGRLFGLTNFNTTASATAVHRPRDVMIIVDLSGSMRFQNLPGVPLNGSGQASPGSTNLGARQASLNPEAVYPQYGHYTSATAALQGTSSIATATGEFVDPSNISSDQPPGPNVLGNDFYGNAPGVAPGPANVAFTRAPDSYATAPGGDAPLKITKDTGATYAQTVKDVVGGTLYDLNFETLGYDKYRVNKFAKYTMGPGFWGKTFWIWPPDPRGPLATNPTPLPANYADNGSNDWRQRFFIKVNTSTQALGWLDHNTILYSSTGAVNAPGTATAVTEGGVSVTYTYRINYAAVFQWLFNDLDPNTLKKNNPFPSTMQAGRIRYYSKLPDPTDTTLNNRFWTTQTLPDLSERFWRAYVDYVLGVRVNGSSGGYATYANTIGSGMPVSGAIGNGDLFTWGTMQISDKPDPSDTSPYETGAINHVGGYAAGTTVLTVKNLTTAPLVGEYIKVGATASYYKVTAATTTQITISSGLTAACLNSDAVAVLHPTYMDYQDNPKRPRHQYFFGPMTFFDFISNYETGTFWMPGASHEAHAWACKAGVQSAIDDIRNNHPNDFVGMTFFSSPSTSNAGGGHHNFAVVALGRNYQQLKDSLWFPPTTVTGGVTEITPYDTDMTNAPRASGGTAPGMGFMIAYNQFSSSTTNLRFYAQPSYNLPSNNVPNYRGSAGGLGRKGANRLIIFETDGVPNTRAFATIVSAGANSYYPIRIGNTQNIGDSTLNKEFPSGGSYANSEVYGIVQQICAMDSAAPPGYSNKRKQVQVHCIGYGGDFDPANAGTNETNALTFLQTVEYYGGVAADTDPTHFPAYKRIYGPYNQRITNMQTAFSTIMQAGVQVSLIQ